jgi:hypothetical protein
MILLSSDVNEEKRKKHRQTLLSTMNHYNRYIDFSFLKYGISSCKEEIKQLIKETGVIVYIYLACHDR